MKYFFLITVLIVGNAFAQTEIQTAITDIGKVKLEAEATLTATPYRAKEHQALKNYFVTLNSFALRTKADSRTNKRLNSHVTAQNMAKFCSSIFVSLNDWDQIIVNCTRNRFFLCTEDVLEYPKSKIILAESLSPDLSQIFKNTSECK